MKRLVYAGMAVGMFVVAATSWGPGAKMTYAASTPAENVQSQEAYEAEEKPEAGEAIEAIEAIQKVQPGQPLPSVLLKGMDGKMYDTGAKRNKALVISFWASWCEPCRLEAPMLNELYNKHKHEVDVYGINVTRYDRLEDARKFARSLGLEFPVLLDEQGTLFERFQGAAFPTHVLVDRHGRVQEIIIGMLSERELERKMESLQKKAVSLGSG